MLEKNSSHFSQIKRGQNSNSKSNNSMHTTIRRNRCICRRVSAGHRAVRRRLLLGSLRHRSRGRRRRAKDTQRKKHVVHLIHRQLVVGVYAVRHRGLVDAGGDVDLAAGGGDVERERPVGAVAGLSAERVAHGLELSGGEERWEDVELNQRHLLLVGEGVEGAGGEVGEGVIGRGEDG